MGPPGSLNVDPVTVDLMITLHIIMSSIMPVFLYPL